MNSSASTVAEGTIPCLEVAAALGALIDPETLRLLHAVPVTPAPGA